ncbi:MAG TPA: acyloxyacyl hydrolase [Candidatus Binatia bacterium]|nr:acyloxyacyl hydrolase [Candidatus Binatia bacterium]
MKKRGLFIVALAGVLFSPVLTLSNRCASAAELVTQSAGYDSLFGFGRQSIGISAGHGLALPIGGTAGEGLRDVQFIYLSPRWGVGISDPMGGNRWFRGNFEFLVEGVFLYEFQPKNGIAGGITPLVRYNFLTGNRLIPFVQAGAGILALDFDLKRHADGLNFTLQGGAGIHYFIWDRAALTGEWRFHHLSNADLHRRNAGINSSVVLFGITLFLR